MKYELGVSTDNINDKNLVKHRPNKPCMSIMCGSTQHFHLLLYNLLSITNIHLLVFINKKYKTDTEIKETSDNVCKEHLEKLQYPLNNNLHNM